MTIYEFEKLADANRKKWPMRGICAEKALKLHELWFLNKHVGKYWYGCINCKEVIKTDHELEL